MRRGRTAIAQEEAIATRRRADRVDRALRVTPRGATLTALGILAVGALVLWFALRGDSARRQAVGTLAIGADSARVHAALGAPARDCPTGSLEHLRNHMPEDTPPALLEGTLEDLRRRTARRWVYPRDGEAAGCTARADATEIGLDREGRVLWYVPVTGKTPVELPEVDAAGTP